jgi:4-diphosphocytidyl-2-C-methyl-D-erythritol kinase
VAAIKEKLYELGAVYASMSGSGSSLFGFFEEKPNLDGLFGDAYVFCEKL